MAIKIGTKVTGNWGAMHPVSEGEIVKIEKHGVEILWDDDDITNVDYCSLDSLHVKGYTSANGSPIGIFIEETV